MDANPNIPLSTAARDRIDAVFEKPLREDAAGIVMIRCGRGLPFYRSTDTNDYDRIRFAVIKLSKGNLPDLERCCDDAHEDWRDVLVAAGFGDDPAAHLKWVP